MRLDFYCLRNIHDRRAPGEESRDLTQIGDIILGAGEGLCHSCNASAHGGGSPLGARRSLRWPASLPEGQLRSFRVWRDLSTNIMEVVS